MDGVPGNIGRHGFTVAWIVWGTAPLESMAATGPALSMIGAKISHLYCKKSVNLILNIVLFALAVFVAYGRFGSIPL